MIKITRNNAHISVEGKNWLEEKIDINLKPVLSDTGLEFLNWQKLLAAQICITFEITPQLVGAITEKYNAENYEQLLLRWIEQFNKSQSNE